MQKLENGSLRNTLMLLVALVGLAVAHDDLGRARTEAGRPNYRDDKKEFQGRGDNDRDDRRGRNDDDWDDNDNYHNSESYSVGLWGDMPYSDTQAKYGVPNLIMDMNRQELAFTVHNGDFKAGSELAGSVTPATCDNAKYDQALGFLNALRAPAAFTPGDNDWTDCDNGTAANSNGPFNSLERLDLERPFFFGTPFTNGYTNCARPCNAISRRGQHAVPRIRSRPAAPSMHQRSDTYQVEERPCVENRRWTYRGVTYVTLNIQGSCDNRCEDHPDTKKRTTVQHADIAWMRETFQVAKDRDSAGVMIISQADPGFSDRPVESEPARDPKTLVCKTTGTGACTATTPDGFQAFLTALRAEVIGFGKPVAYVHGDTHFFRVDKPFLDSKGQRLEKFTRIETFGDNVFTTDPLHPDPGDLNNIHWVKVFVDPDSREVFAIQPQIVPANVVVHPIP